MFIGPNDLAADMGYRGNIPHPEVQKTIADTIRRITACGKAAGTLVVKPTAGGSSTSARYLLQSAPMPASCAQNCEALAARLNR